MRCDAAGQRAGATARGPAERAGLASPRRARSTPAGGERAAERGRAERDREGHGGGPERCPVGGEPRCGGAVMPGARPKESRTGLTQADPERPRPGEAGRRGTARGTAGVPGKARPEASRGAVIWRQKYRKCPESWEGRPPSGCPGRARRPARRRPTRALFFASRCADFLCQKRTFQSVPFRHLPPPVWCTYYKGEGASGGRGGYGPTNSSPVFSGPPRSGQRTAGPAPPSRPETARLPPGRPAKGKQNWLDPSRSGAPQPAKAARGPAEREQDWLDPGGPGAPRPAATAGARPKESRTGLTQADPEHPGRRRPPGPGRKRAGLAW